MTVKKNEKARGDRVDSYGTIEEHVEKATWRSTMFSVFICLTITAEGYDWGVLNGAMVRIQDEMNLSTLDLSVLASVTPLAVALGSLSGAQLADWYGRRFTFLSAALILGIGPLAMALAPGFRVLIFGRFITGFGIGISLLVVGLLISEVAPAKNRGQLLGLEDVFLNVGCVGGYLANVILNGVVHDWRYMLALGSIMPFVNWAWAMCDTTVVPESPRWLLMVGQREEAQLVLQSYVGKNEADAVLGSLQDDAPAPWSEVFVPTDAGDRRAIFVGLGVIVVSCLTGVIVFSYFSSYILKDRLGEANAFSVTLVMGVVRALISMLVVWRMDTFGRRSIFLFGLTVTVATLGLLGASYAFLWPVWMEVVIFIVLVAAYACGITSVPIIYIAEIYPLYLRARAGGLALSVSRFYNFAALFCFPLILASFGKAWTFSVMAAVNVLGIVFIWQVMPETRGKNLEQINMIFNAKNIV